MEEVMRNLSKVIVSTAAAAAFATLAVPVSAADLLPLKVSKECSKYTGDNPSFCTITESSLGALPAGTKVLYYGPVTNNPNFSTNNVVLDDGAGNTAAGNCIVYFGAGPAGMCAFYAGSGKLAGFQAVVKVSVDGKQIWHWEGGYLLGAATQ
jgi:hypothetical protein